MSSEFLSSIDDIVQVVTNVQSELSGVELTSAQARIAEATEILERALTDSDATGIQESLLVAREHVDRAAAALGVARENLTAYVAAVLMPSRRVEIRQDAAPVVMPKPRSAATECLDQAADRMVLEGTLPDGRRAAEVLPNDGKVRRFEGPCPVSGCQTIGTIICLGNNAMAYQGSGSCLQFQQQLDAGR